MSIFDKEITKEELFEKLKESMETPNIVKQNFPMRLYYMAKDTYHNNKAEQEIIDKMYKGDQGKVTNVLIIDDNSAIIKTKQVLFGDEEKDWYRIYFNDRVYSECTDNFDHALIMLVCARHNGLINSDAANLIAKMLGITAE